jgi:hypothetical protein
VPEDYANPSDGGSGQLTCRANSLLSWTESPLFAILDYTETSRTIGEDPVVSIVRVGLAETKHFAEGYDAIFGKNKAAQAKKRPTAAKRSSTKKKKTTKKR